MNESRLFTWYKKPHAYRIKGEWYCYWRGLVMSAPTLEGAYDKLIRLMAWRTKLGLSHEQR